MSANEKGRNGGDRATPKTACKCKSSAFAHRFKVLVVVAVCWGLLPVKLADWILRRFDTEGL